VDIVRGTLLCELEDQKSIAEWLQRGDYSSRRLLPSMIPDALFVHMLYLLYRGEFTRLLGTVQALESIGVRFGPLSVVLKSLTLAVCHLLMGDRDQASILVEQAGKSAMPDGMVYLFASYTLGLQSLNDKLIEQEYPSLADKYYEIKKHLLSGWDTLSAIISPNELAPDLTPREYEVAKLAAEGLHNSEIAEKLVVSESTVRTHLRTLFQKLEVDRRSKLAEKLK
jgi:LuxR family maltose regulon positive regulatory protein